MVFTHTKNKNAFSDLEKCKENIFYKNTMWMFFFNIKMHFEGFLQ